MNRDQLQIALDDAMSKEDALAVVIGIHDDGRDIVLKCFASGLTSPDYKLLAAEALLAGARERLSLDARCRLDYLRRELLRLVEEEDVAPAPAPNAPRVTALN